MKTTKYLNSAFVIAALLVSSSAMAADGGSNFSNDLAMLFALVSLALIMLLVVFFLANTIKSLTGNNEWLSKMMDKTNSTKSIIALMVLSFATESVFAQDAGNSTMPFVMSDLVFYTLISINVILFVVILFLYKTVKDVIRILTGQKEDNTVTEEAGVFSKVMVALTDSVPIEEEHKVMTDHEYDGIRELDNNLPPWWVYGFWVTIVFAVAYMFYYHVLDAGPLQIEEYKIELAEAETRRAAYIERMGNLIDETNVEYTDNASLLAEAKDLYIANCAACHGAEGQGGVGPNLTDQYWLHGGSVSDIFSIIKYGVTEKGMISWQAQFSPVQMQGLTSYILNMQGTNPPNPKEPQGDIYQAPIEEVTTEETAVSEVSKHDENNQQAGMN